jgi:hypothetical protein
MTSPSAVELAALPLVPINALEVKMLVEVLKSLF